MARIFPTHQNVKVFCFVTAHLPLLLINLLAYNDFSGQARIFEPAPESKSLLVLFFRKEQESSFSAEKEAKRLLFPARRFQRYGTWPESDCKSASSRISQG